MNAWYANLANKRVLIVGCGATGASAARFAAAAGAIVRVVDSRGVAPAAETLAAELPEVEIMTGGLPVEALAGMKFLCVQDPGESGMADESAVLKRVRSVLEQLFPTPSKWEKPGK